MLNFFNSAPAPLSDGTDVNTGSLIAESLVGSSISANESDEVEPPEDLNARALEVINRIQAKLTGRDFAKSAGIK